MSSSIVEVIRALHQENELQVQKIITDLTVVTKSRKNQLLRNTRVKKRLDLILGNLRQLKGLYYEDDSVLRQHVEGLMINNQHQFNQFIQKISQIKDSFSNFPNRISYSLDSTADEMPDDEVSGVKIDDLFLQAEYRGKVVDLASFFTRFKNLQQFKAFEGMHKLTRFDYITFLQNFDDALHLFGLKQKSELSYGALKEYSDYQQDISDYIRGYVGKLHPTVPLEEMDKEIQASFETLVNNEALPGYFNVDLEEFDEREPKQYGLSFTMERLEEDINYMKDHNVNKLGNSNNSSASTNDIFCLPCQKGFTKQGIYDSHLNGKKHMKASEQKVTKGGDDVEISGSGSSCSNTNANSASSTLLKIALVEYSLMHYADLLRDVIDYSIIVADKIFTVGYVDVEESEEEEVPAKKTVASVTTLHNPKNVPLGWDGKPIPLWMYKLHGLNIDYACEICGGDVHKGDRNFIKHFREWKHTYMLKCLGILNSQHFVNVPTIKEAQALHERLKAETSLREFSVQREEEMEDAMGNVYSREEYEQHKSHGLIF